MTIGRRHILRAAGGGAVLAAGLSATAPARALTLEAAPAPLAERYAAACAAEAEFHARLRRDLAAALAAQGAPADPASLDRLVAAASCPRCGCPLGG